MLPDSRPTALPAPRSPATLKSELRAAAQSAGFDILRITAPSGIGRAGVHLRQFIDAGCHGDMDWLATRLEQRSDPTALWPDVRSVIMLGLNYAPAADPIATKVASNKGVISAYARGRDYHDVVKKGLKTVAHRLHADTGHAVKIFVDTAPLMEKPLAQAAGIGWQGKHTNLVSRIAGGSWLFLGAVLTTAELEPDAAEVDHCGSCTRCLDACPTNAFPAPYRLDARRCIAYLTIEHRGFIERALRTAIGNRIFGCDDCLAVCPWNKFAEAARNQRLAAKAETDNPPLAELLDLDDAGFRARFAGTPIKRTGRDRFIRNVLIAAGNAGDPALVPKVAALLEDPSPLVRGMAAWALGRLVAPDVWAQMRQTHLISEADPEVRAEWSEAP